MAITAVEASTEFSSAAESATSRAASNSWTPTANIWYLVAVESSGSTGTHSLTGNGITWSLEANVGALYWFLGKGASPTTDALTLTYTGTSTGIGSSITELGGDIDPTDPVVGTNATNSGTATTATVTHAAYASTTNAAIAAFRVAVGTAVDVTPETDWTELGDASHGSPNAHLQVQFRANAGSVPDLTCTAAWDGSSVAYAAILLELAAAAAGGRTTKNTRAFPLGERVGMGFGMAGD